jgi:hypothetical protein
MSKSLEMLTMLVVFSSLVDVTKVWFRASGEKGPRRRHRALHFAPSVLIFLTLQTRKTLLHRSAVYRSPAGWLAKLFPPSCLTLIAVMARCRVVCEANMELLLMIYWVGLVCSVLCCALCLCRSGY